MKTHAIRAILPVVSLFGLVAGCGDEEPSASNTTTAAATTSGATTTSSGTGGDASSTSASTSATSGTGGAGGSGEGGNGGASATTGTGGAGGEGGAGGATAATTATSSSSGSGGAGGAGGADPVSPFGSPITQTISVSATGHDRMYGVAFDAAGNLYGCGQVAPGTDSASDYSLFVAKILPNGMLDQAYGTGGIATQNVIVGTSGENARTCVVQSTGKVIVVGQAEVPNAADARDRDIVAVRFDTNGTLDTTFGVGGVARVSLSVGVLAGNAYLADAAWGAAVQPDDRIVIEGAKVGANMVDTDYAVVRLNPNGTVDDFFGTAGVVSFDLFNVNASARNIRVAADGSLFGSGYVDNAGVVQPVLFKLTPTGALDPTFGNNGIFTQGIFDPALEAYSFDFQGTSLVTNGYGKSDAAAANDFLSVRVLANGTLDPSYGSNGVAQIDVAGFSDQGRNNIVLPDGRVVLVGGGRTTSTTSDGMVVLLTQDGKPDTSFAPNGYQLFDSTGAADFFWGVAVNESGTMMAVSGLQSGTPFTQDDSLVVLFPLL